jgi:O-antigen ligase
MRLSNKYLEYAFLIFSAILILGVFNPYSRALMSVGMIGIILCGLSTKWLFKDIAKHPLGDYKVWFQFLPVFVLYAIGLFWTEDLSYGWDRVQVKLPFLALPIGFYFLAPYLTYATIQKVLFLFCLACSVTALGSLVNYAMHFEEINESYHHAKTLPVVISHIRYSLLLTISIAVSYQLFTDKFSWGIITYKVHAPMAVFIFIFLHILAVRSGLLAMYGSLFGVVVLQAFFQKKYSLLLAIPAFLVVGVALYFLSPSLRNKAAYMQKDVSQYTEGKNVNNYSDGNRLLSMQIGWTIAKQNWIFGVGSGDAKKVMDEYYIEHYPEISEVNRLIPHNQLVYILLVGGMVGVVVFLVCLLIPLTSIDIWKDIPMMVVIISVYSSFLSEATLELQHGVLLCSYILGLVYLRMLKSYE